MGRVLQLVISRKLLNIVPPCRPWSNPTILVELPKGEGGGSRSAVGDFQERVSATLPAMVGPVHNARVAEMGGRGSRSAVSDFQERASAALPGLCIAWPKEVGGGSRSAECALADTV